MRISYNWLKELLPDLTASPVEVAELLTLHSFETYVVGEVALPAGVRAVKITRIEKHPNADRLQLATVSDGEKEITVVCGAPNIQIEQIVPYAPPGTKLKGEKNEDLIVKEAKIRGMKSPGMLNSLRELGLHHDHGGIWVLPGDTSLGTELSTLIPADTILEADVTPNRAHDCLSHIGIAREIAALLSLSINEPSSSELPQPQAEVDGWKVTLADPRLSPRYLGVILDDLVVQVSPLWLQARLLSVGGKPINNLVDITNLVMFEYGNPTHLFDQKNLPGKNIAVRPAKTKEQLVLLDDTVQDLSENDLVIVARDTPVALAGVMGGKLSSVSSHTTQGLLEVANFNAYSVQETARRLNVRTEASARFSKGLDPNLAQPAAERTVSLLIEIASARLVGVIDAYPKPVKPRTISFNPDRVGQIAGVDIFTPAQSKKALEGLRLKVAAKKKPWQVTIPTDRLDLMGEHDLIEEVIRFVGLAAIQPSSPDSSLSRSLPEKIYWREAIRDTLLELGLTETYNQSFEPEAYALLAELHAEKHLSLVNPPAPELKNLRVSLMPGLIANLAKNRDLFQRNAGRKESALFEIGHVYRPGKKGRVPGVIEENHLAAVVVGAQPSLQAIAERLQEVLGLDSIPLKNCLAATVARTLKYHLPIQGFEINLDELLIGIEKPVPSLRTLEEIQAENLAASRFTPLPKFPSVFRDISLVVDPAVSASRAQEIIERAGGKLVADVDLFDEFEPQGSVQKSLAFHIEYRSPERTLTDKEIDRLHAKITTALETELGAEIR